MSRVLLSVLVMALVTLFTRAAPFLFFSRRRPPAFLDYLQRYIPPVVMSLLVLASFKDIDFAAALKARSEGLGKDQSVAQATRYRVPVMPSLDGNTVEMATEQTAFAENAVGYQATLSFIKGRVDTITRALKGD